MKKAAETERISKNMLPPTIVETEARVPVQSHETFDLKQKQKQNTSEAYNRIIQNVYSVSF